MTISCQADSAGATCRQLKMGYYQTCIIATQTVGRAVAKAETNVDFRDFSWADRPETERALYSQCAKQRCLEFGTERNSSGELKVRQLDK